MFLQALKVALIVLLYKRDFPFLDLDILGGLLLVRDLLHSLRAVVRLKVDLLAHLDVLGQEADPEKDARDGGEDVVVLECHQVVLDYFDLLEVLDGFVELELALLTAEFYCLFVGNNVAPLFLDGALVAEEDFQDLQ